MRLTTYFAIIVSMLILTFMGIQVAEEFERNYISRHIATSIGQSVEIYRSSGNER